MRVILDIPTVALRWGPKNKVAHIVTSGADIWALRRGREERLADGYVDVACHNGEIESRHRLMMGDGLPLCRRCVRALNSFADAGLTFTPSTTYKRGSRAAMSGLDQRLARVYDRLRKRSQRRTLGNFTDISGGVNDVYEAGMVDALDAIREELT